MTMPDHSGWTPESGRSTQISSPVATTNNSSVETTVGNTVEVGSEAIKVIV